MELTPNPADRSRHPARPACYVLLAFMVSALFSACAKTTDQNDDPRLLVIDGIEIRFDELQPYIDFLGSFRPELGKKTKQITAMSDYLLPLKVAQREFATERSEQLVLAQGLCSVASTIYELEQQTELVKSKRRANLTRLSAHLPVAMFLFDESKQGAVSPPLEMPQGYFVVGSYDFHESPLMMADYVDCLQVAFATHTSKSWYEWWKEYQATLGSRVTYVHPKYRDNIPNWMQLPKPN